jgi:APA family basic amino acid/polyamine antiporter
MARNQLFAKKSLEVLLEEMAGEHRLRRVLGPVTLASLGIGGIIGTGIFVLTGLAARNYAGPGLVVSFIIAGLACAFAALCYAEFASMAPVAGSAYTYAYVSLGELVAWIIGWDLVLEYAMASATVANGWSNYFLKFLDLFKDKAGKALFIIPLWLSMDPFTAATQHIDYRTAGTLEVASATALPMNVGSATKWVSLPLGKETGTHRVADVKVEFTTASVAAVKELHGEKHAKQSIERIQKALQDNLQYNAMAEPASVLADIRSNEKHGFDAYEQTPLKLGSLHLTVNFVAIAITLIITTILVVGIRESASFNAVMVLIKVGAVLFVIIAGIGHIDASNWTPFMPYGWKGVLGAAGVIFFAYIGFDAVSTHAEEARNPKTDVPIGIISSLAVCTVLYIAVAAVVTGMIPYPEIPLNAPISGTFDKFGLASASVVITIGALTGITSVLLVMLQSQPRVLLAMARDGLLPANFFGAVHPRLRTPHKGTIVTGIFCLVASSLFPLEALGHMVSIGTLFAFVVVCSAVWLMRHINPQAERPFRTPLMNFVAPSGIVLCLIMMVYLGWQNWVRLFAWLAIGLVIYFTYGRHHSHLGKSLRGEISRHGVSPAGVPLDDGSEPGTNVSGEQGV